MHVLVSLGLAVLVVLLTVLLLRDSPPMPSSASGSNSAQTSVSLTSKWKRALHTPPNRRRPAPAAVRVQFAAMEASWLAHPVRDAWQPPPRILWLHWDTLPLPAFIEKCVERTRSVLATSAHAWDVRLVTTQSALDTLRAATMHGSQSSHGSQSLHRDTAVEGFVLPLKFAMVSPTHKCDFLRLALLAVFGGVYMDASVILNASLDGFFDATCAARADLGALYGRKHTRHATVPDIENFFLIAPPASPVIQAWLAEFAYAIDKGFVPYKHELTALGVDKQGHDTTYFTAYAALQAVLQLGTLDTPPRMLLKDTETTAYALQEACAWSTQCIARVSRTQQASTYDMIKVPKGHRGSFALDFFDSFPPPLSTQQAGGK
jgi:hypothetical protein